MVKERKGQILKGLILDVKGFELDFENHEQESGIIRSAIRNITQDMLWKIMALGGGDGEGDRRIS